RRALDSEQHGLAHCARRDGLPGDRADRQHRDPHPRQRLAKGNARPRAAWRVLRRASGAAPMGLIGRVLKFLRSTENGAHVADVELELSDGDRVTARHFSSPGDDSPPLKSDRLVVIELPGVTEAVVVGYLMSVESLAELGEKRLFARGDDGAPAMAVWLKKTGGGSGRAQPSLELGLNPTDRVA